MLPNVFWKIKILAAFFGNNSQYDILFVSVYAQVAHVEISALACILQLLIRSGNIIVGKEKQAS